MKNEYCVYKITNKLNGKIYIGMSKNLKARWSANGIHYKQSKRFYNAIQKYGWNNFNKEILVENLSFEEACSLEVEIISKYNSRDKKIGYNIAEGGNGGIIYLTHPKGMLGKKQTEYQKTSHREWASKKENNCMTNGKVVWGETHNHPMGFLDKKHKEESKKKTSKTLKERGVNKKRIKAISKDGNEIEFSSREECSLYFLNTKGSSTIDKLLKSNKPYVIHRSLNTRLRKNHEKLEGYTLKYIQEDNSEV